MTLRTAALGRWAGLAAALLLTVPGVLRPLSGSLLDHVDLVFHEAGHVIFSPFGETLMLLGGSVMQVLVPLGCALTFLFRRDRYAAGLVTLWTAQSLAGVAAYVRDAPTRNLDLITGDPDTHDWWQLLGAADALSLAAPLGNMLAFLAFACLVAGVLLAVWDDVR
ncbi:hypothetical protein HNQ07_000708 [Deinococcus metalli]|uniref:Uncharacterized protein n=1 Tax=Deinococcus metalli TaxID=1141878 RepID=A0A7W8KBR3_9DEIO|nr:hypothetical protein [Deinococcus metalli]MBB5375264.1 hypothetical protein [Deinococcus metalli]GHF30546.1 hypothetical protein GCM10017781_03330 [Deinococcus metalli]